MRDWHETRMTDVKDNKQRQWKGLSRAAAGGRRTRPSSPDTDILITDTCIAHRAMDEFS